MTGFAIRHADGRFAFGEVIHRRFAVTEGVRELKRALKRYRVFATPALAAAARDQYLREMRAEGFEEVAGGATKLHLRQIRYDWADRPGRAKPWTIISLQAAPPPTPPGSRTRRSATRGRASGPARRR